MQNEFFTDKVHLITNRYKFRNDQITQIKVETNKYIIYNSTNTCISYLIHINLIII
jgi:hypothetical protein